MEIEKQTTTTLIEKIKEERVNLHNLGIETSKVIVGQKNVMEFVTIALLCNGHILLEGVPGIAKTTMVKALSKALGFNFNRIQFTPDLLPTDLIGTLIYNQKIQDFETKKGPLFTNLVLADEINRAPAKVQAALLEAMQEHQVTIGSETYQLEEPFLVFATQNPIEQEGTYRLPEAQVDRFMFKLYVNHPSHQEEKEILRRSLDLNSISQVFNKDDLFRAQKLVKDIYVDEKVIDYIVSLVFATRNYSSSKFIDLKDLIKYGVSPRASLALHEACKAHAFLDGRHFVTPDDVKMVIYPILRHRLILSYQAEAEGITPDEIVASILRAVPVP